MDDRRRRLTILVLLTLILLNDRWPSWAAQQTAVAQASTVQASTVQAAAVRAARVERAPVIDGRIDDEAWGGAARIETFHQVQPGDSLAPSQPTPVLIGY